MLFVADINFHSEINFRRYCNLKNTKIARVWIELKRLSCFVRHSSTKYLAQFTKLSKKFNIESSIADLFQFSRVLPDIHFCKGYWILGIRLQLITGFPKISKEAIRIKLFSNW